MKRSVDFHPRNAQLVPPVGALDPNGAVLAIKLENLELAGVVRTGLDILVRSGEQLQILAFGEIDGVRAVFPEAYRSHATAIAAIVDRLEEWFDAHLGDELPMLYFLVSDDALEALARDESGYAVVPGLADYDRLVSICDRYRAIAGYAAGRSVLDLSKSLGYGAHILAAVGATRLSVVADAPNGVLVDQLGIAPRAAAERADLVVCFGVDSASIEAALDRCRPYLEDGGLIALGVRGPDAGAALQRAGLAGSPIARIAGDTHPPLDEYLTIVGLDATEEDAAPAPPVTVSRRPLRILFVLRPSAGKTFGGDVVQVRQTAAGLARRGHDAAVTTALAFDPSGYDVVHFSNLTIPRETLAQMQNVRGFPGAIVTMPIFTDHADETAWALQLQTALFARPNDTAQLEAYLEHFAQRQFTVTLPLYGRDIGAGERIEMDRDYLAMQLEICRRSDYFIANAHAEMHRVYRFLDPTIPYAVAPSAIDPVIYHPERAEEFRKRYHLGEFALLPGRFEARKNQLMLLAALRGSGIQTVFIGRSYETPYGDLVRSYLGEKTIVLRHMSETDLAGALAAARVVVVPSYDEVVSLTSLNAAACGASIVLTRQSYEHEYLRDDAEYCDPVNVASVRDAVHRAWNTHDERLERRLELSRRVRSEYTWDRAAEATEEAYYRVLASNPRARARIAQTA
ncbi:MAG: hypothetical protein NVS3B28_23340 [Candidatus Velthaea sp.]